MCSKTAYLLLVVLTLVFCGDVAAEVFYEYYEHNIDRAALGDPPGWMPPYNTWPVKKTGAVEDFDISVRDRNDDFAFRFTAYLAIQTQGDYTFWSASDDGSQVVIDGSLVVNNSGWHAMSTVGTGTIYLSAGFHSIVVTHFEDSGQEGLQVHYRGPGISRREIPPVMVETEEWVETTAAVVASERPSVAEVEELERTAMLPVRVRRGRLL